MKIALAMAAVLALLVSQARAVITVNSVVENAESPTAIRTQAIIKEATGLQDGAQNIAVAIKEINASILIRDGEIQNGLMLKKKRLPASEAWGQGLPMGYKTPPFTDPKGPWFGLTWPYRDQYDYFADDTDPLADDVGIIFEDQPGVYGIIDIEGIMRGGPTDPVEPPGMNTPEWLKRGITGSGLEGPATYMQFEIIPLLGPGDREITLRIFGASAIVVQRNTQTGLFSEIRVPIPDFQTTIRLPEPAGMSVVALMSLVALRRRRR